MEKNGGKNNTKGYGVQIIKTWYWYDSWLAVVSQHCRSNKGKYQ